MSGVVGPDPEFAHGAPIAPAPVLVRLRFTCAVPTTVCSPIPMSPRTFGV